MGEPRQVKMARLKQQMREHNLRIIRSRQDEERQASGQERRQKPRASGSPYRAGGTEPPTRPAA